MPRPYFVRSGDSYTDLLSTLYGFQIALLVVQLGAYGFDFFVSGGLCFPTVDRFDSLDYWRLYGVALDIVVPIAMFSLLWHPQSNGMYWMAFLVSGVGAVLNSAVVFSYIKDYNQCSTTLWCSCFPELTDDSTDRDWPFIAKTAVVALHALLCFEYAIFVNIMWRNETFRVWLRHIAGSSGDPYMRFGYGPTVGNYFAGGEGGGAYTDPRAFSAPIGSALGQDASAAAAAMELGDGATPMGMPMHEMPRAQQPIGSPLQQHQDASGVPLGIDITVSSPAAIGYLLQQQQPASGNKHHNH